MSFTNLSRHRLFPYILVVLLTLPAIFALFRPGYYNMHDDMQMIRQLEMEKCLLDGQIPCRWTPDLGFGYGYPLFNFYPPLPYLVGQVFRIFGLSFVWSVKLTAVFQFIFAALAMYLLAKTLFGKLGGLISSTLYTYAPYHSVNIYVRGAMNEAWAGVFFPLIFYFSRGLILKPSRNHFLGLSLSLAGLFLSHNPMALTFAPILATWSLFWYLQKARSFRPSQLVKNRGSLIILIVGGLFALGLTAFYTLPVLLESKLVQIESMFTNYYHFSVHFVTIKQLFFSSFWGDGPSVWGDKDGMSFSLGYFHWLITAAIFFVTLFQTLKKRRLDQKSALILVLFGLSAWTIFMTHNRSTFIWLLLSPIQKIQFPWRFLSHASFLLSLSAGSSALFLSSVKRSSKVFFAFFLIAGVILYNYPYFHPVISGPITDQQKFSGLAWQNQITSGIYDYLPKTSSTAPKGHAAEIIDNYTGPTAPQVSGLKKGTDWTFVNLSLASPSEITLAILGFPKFVALDNGQEIPLKIEPELGRLVVNLSAGNHQLYLKFHDTPVRTFGNVVSIICWLSLIITSLRLLWIKKSIKK